jgi:hypothetical protein
MLATTKADNHDGQRHSATVDFVLIHSSRLKLLNVCRMQKVGCSEMKCEVSKN